MDRRSCQVLLGYFNRCSPLVTTTVAEVGAMNDALVGLQQIAAGEVACELKRVVRPSAEQPETPPAPPFNPLGS
jgi:hypothetical protein